MNKAKIYDEEFSKLVRDHIEYNENSISCLRWIKKVGFKVAVGDDAFTALGRNGYRTGRLFGNQLYAHRVVWFLISGSWPENQIDHLDGDRKNNKKDNLRSVSQSINSKNIKMLSTNTTGFTGVVFYKRDKRFSAGFCEKGKRINVKCDGSLLDAVASLISARRSHGEFTDRHGF